MRHPTIAAIAKAEIEHRIRAPRAYKLDHDRLNWLRNNMDTAVSIHAEWIRNGRPKSRADLQVPGSASE